MLRLLPLITAHLLLLPPLAVALASLTRLSHPAADLVAHFVAPALVATLGLTLLLALLNLRPAVISAMGVTALLVMAHWPQWFPGNGPIPNEPQPSLSVYSANLWVHNQDLDAIASSIKQADADVLILVEFGTHARQEAERLLADYPHRLYASRDNHPARTAIASRYPLSRIESHQHRETVAGVAQTPLGPVTLIGAHFTRPWPYSEPHKQLDQVKGMNELVQGLKGPLILAGDFNALSSGLVGREISSLMGLIPAPAWPGTWPHPLPSPLGITIDQVWFTPDLHLKSRQLGPANGSDHRPVITHFTKAGPPVE